MKYCKYCGAELEDRMQYCPQCGRPSEEEQQAPEDIWAQRLAPETLQQDPDLQPLEEKTDRPGRKHQEDPVTIYFPEEAESHRRGRARIRRLRVVVAVLCCFVVALVCLMIALMAMRRTNVQSDLYYGRACTVGDQEYSGQGDWVSLFSDGKAEVSLMNMGGRGTWTQHGPEIEIDCGDLVYRGTLENGILELRQGDILFLLSREAVQALPAPEVLPGINASVWAGDYYGWWQVTKAWGSWKSIAGNRWDVCGSLWLETDTEGKLELWDTDCRADELICEAVIRIVTGTTDAGALENLRGVFCGMPIPAGAWHMDPGREPYFSMPGVLCLTGSFSQEESGFEYAVFLRPWGMEWDDVETMPSDPLPRKKRLPELYRDWYLPMIREGAPMPGSFYSGE